MWKFKNSFFFLAALLTVLAGCNVQQVSLLDNYYGASEVELIKAFGVPDSTYDLGDSEKLFTYVRSRNDVHDSTRYSSFGSTTSINISNAVVVEQTCMINFVLFNGYVSEYSTQGDCAQYIDYIIVQ